MTMSAHDSPRTPLMSPHPVSSQTFDGLFEVLARQPENSTALAALQKGLREGGPEAAACYQEFKPVCHAALTAVLQHHGHFANELRRLAAAQVCHRHQLHGGQVPVTVERLAALAADPLCTLMLAESINTNLTLEQFLTRARTFLLRCHPGEPALLARLRPLLVALVQQVFNNEFVWPVTEAEELAVAALGEELMRTVQAGDNSRIEPLLLLHALYQPLAAHAEAARLAAMPLASFSGDLHPLLTRILHEPRREMELRATIPTLEEVRDPVSRSVRAQYEESPYPRWVRFSGTPKTIRERIQRVRPGFEGPLAGSGQRLQVLVAGCGTGQHSLQVALGNPEADVLAVDLSSASLAYAMRMSERHGARNLTFLQGDLLALPRLGRKFHHIECAGVLHHIKDHAAAWAVLAQCLQPGGTMKIGVYSQAARLLVSHLRACIQREGIGTSPNAVRLFRTRLLTEPAWAGLLPLLERMSDFFSLSMTRDFLFHVQEHQYTVAEIEGIARALGLELIGVQLSRRSVDYLKSKGTLAEPRVQTFAQWRAIEQAYVGSLEMFQFWLQLPAPAGPASAVASLGRVRGAASQ